MPKLSRILLLLFFLTGAVLFASRAQAVMVDGQNPSSFVGYVRDEIVAKFDRTVINQMTTQRMQQGRFGIAALDQLARKYDVKSMIKQFPGARQRMYRGRRIDLLGWHRIQFSKEVDVEKVVEAFKKMPGVVDAQPIGIHRVLRTANDSPVFRAVAPGPIKRP